MQEITKTEDRRPKTRIIWLILIAVTIFIYFFGLNIPLLGPDEPRYSQVAREMFERGDWVTPTLGGANWFEKPALLYWLQIVSYKIFGVTEFAARFGSAILGLLTVLSLWILGRWSGKGAEEVESRESRVESQEAIKDQKPNPQSNNPEFANWLALIAASSIGLIAFSHGASFDIILTFPITASLVSFFIFDSNLNSSDNASAIPRRRLAVPLFFFYFFIGAGLLAKGLVGIVFPLAIVAFYYLLSRKFPHKTFIFSLFWGTLVSLLVAATWYLPMYQRHGWTFIDEFIIQHHFARYTSNKYQHPQPFWFFWVILPLLTLPWMPFFLMSIWNFFKNLFQRLGVLTPDKSAKVSTFNSQLKTFALAWLLVPLVFFSLSGSKLPGYILPAVPAAVILTAEYVWRLIQKSNRRPIILQGLALAMYVFIIVLMQFFVMKYAPHETVKELIDKANSEGYTTEKVLTMHTISHNAEFYAPNRLIRTEDGKQRKFYSPAEVVTEMNRDQAPDILVLIPLEYLKTLTTSPLVSARVLDDNSELAIVVVSVAKNKLSV